MEADLQEDSDLDAMQSFKNVLQQRRVIMNALKNGSLSCLPGADGYADTQPVVNIVTGKSYDGVRLLLMKEHQKANGFPTAEYITELDFDKAQRARPDLCIRTGEQALSIQHLVQNEKTKEFCGKSSRLFNVDQVNNLLELKRWAEGKQQPEKKQKEAGAEILCTSTDPVKYLGQYFAAMSMGVKFNVNEKQAADFTKNLEGTVYKKIGTSLTTGKAMTNPFRLFDINNKALEHCRDIVRDARKAEQPNQKIEQRESQGVRR